MTKNSQRQILVIEDDELFHKILLACLQEKYETVVCHSAEKALRFLANASPNLILLDINLPGMDGMEFLKKTQADHPHLPVIMLSAVHSIPKVVESVKLGAFDYLTKPVDENRLQLTIERALEASDIKSQLEQRRHLQSDLNRNYKLIGDSPGLQRIKKEIEVLAASDSTVLIQGETGTGKELVAREIYARSPRANEPFVALNCGGIAKDLIESELFGHKKGAFTGAQKEIGKFRLADGGTLLLDEVSELPLKAQTKLLRVLQEQEFYPVGSTELVKVNVRVLASTNRDLTDMVAKGTFREDLFYRLNVYTVLIPPLRERPEDITTLAYHFIKQNNVKFGKNFKEISPDAAEMLRSHPWQGNVRELQNLLERVLLFEEGTVIEKEHLSFMAPSSGLEPSLPDSSLPECGLDSALEKLERKSILRALEIAKWNKTKAAKLLKLSRPALDYRLEKHQLN